jgi:hypothetical protein
MRTPIPPPKAPADLRIRPGPSACAVMGQRPTPVSRSTARGRPRRSQAGEKNPRTRDLTSSPWLKPGDANPWAGGRRFADHPTARSPRPGAASPGGGLPGCREHEEPTTDGPAPRMNPKEGLRPRISAKKRSPGAKPEARKGPVLERTGPSLARQVGSGPAAGQTPVSRRSCRCCRRCSCTRCSRRTGRRRSWPRRGHRRR